MHAMRRQVIILSIFFILSALAVPSVSLKAAQKEDDAEYLRTYVGYSAKKAGVPEIPTLFYNVEDDFEGFCYRPPRVKDRTIYGSGRCIFQTLSPPRAWLRENGFCYQESARFDRIIALTKTVVLKDNIIVGGSRSIELLLMREDAPCNILLFNKEGKVHTTEGTIPVWLFGLHLIYTSYGDIGAWPMPNKKLKNQYMKKFSNPSAISIEHKKYIYRVWMQYLIDHSDETQRWTPFNPKLGMMFG